MSVSIQENFLRARKQSLVPSESSQDKENPVRKTAPPNTLYSLTTFEIFLFDTYVSLLTSTFHVDMTSTCSLFHACPCN